MSFITEIILILCIIYTYTAYIAVDKTRIKINHHENMPI